MYIVPNSTIRLLRNIRLEPDYTNTIYFASVSAQTSYFTSKTKYILTAQSYQRVNKGVCRVNYKAEDLYDCNYLMFQNTSFGSKWFYGFITKIDYINNITADVHYEIDVMQTWLKDMTFSMCFVEREHSGSDNIGDNIIAEPLATGEMVFNEYGKLSNDLDDMAIAVLIVDADSQDYGGRMVDGVFSGAKLIAYSTNTTGVSNLKSKLNEYKQKPDAIAGMYMLPARAITNTIANLDTGIETIFSTVCEDIDYDNLPALTGNETIDGHIVRNKKLFTYPYNYYHIDNANGRSLALRYEFFTTSAGLKNLKPQFKAFLNATMPVTVVLRPKNYKGVKNDDIVKTESIDINSYPMCSWNIDYWTAWLAQNTIPEAISAYTGMLNIAGSAGTSYMSASMGGLKSKPNYEQTSRQETASAVQGAGASVAMVGDIVSRAYSASIHADVLKGSLNNANINVASGLQKFFAGRVSVNKQQAEIIDDFFDRYGYATNRVKVPNITSRASWNYVKTIGSNIDGNIPGDDKHLIDAIFDKGITFWHNGDNVDNYSLNNAPVSP
ncbi:MAG: hypothetical protein J6S67_18420 [Methanobrevibacter sp.]|nr:hypothetical protein [Methanobrevibacter sp.]